MAGYSFTGNPVDYQPPAAPAPKQAAPPPNVGPTGFWQRIGSIGVGKVNALNAYRKVAGSGPTVDSNNSPLKTAARDTGGAAKATGGFVYNIAKDTAKTGGKFVNQGVEEGKQVVDTARMIAASKSKNPVAFENANKQSQKDYAGFKNKGGLGNVGTLTTEKEARQGTAKGAEKIIGATVELGTLVLPGSGKAAEITGKLALEHLGESGVIDAARKAGISVVGDKLAPRAAEDIAGDLVKTKAGQRAVKQAVYKGTNAGVRAATTAGKTGAGFGAYGAGAAAEQGKSAKDVAKAGAESFVEGAAAGGAASLVRTVSGKLIRRGEATTAQNMAKQHIGVTDTSQATAVNVNRPNAPKLLTSGENRPVQGKGFTMTSEANPANAKTSMRLNQINNQLSKVAQGKSYMHPDEVKALVNEKTNIYRAANGATIPKDQADRLTKDIVANGGSTSTVHGEEPTSGYAFAPHKDTEKIIPVNEFKSSHIQDYVNANHDKLSQPGAHLGAWVDGDKVYLDVSHVGSASAETISKAHDAQQLAVFDLQHFKEVPTGKIDENGVYSKLDEASTIHNAHQREISSANTRGGAEPIAEKTQSERLTESAKAPAQAAAVSERPTAELSQRLTKPTTPREEVPLENTNKSAAGGVSGVQEKVAQKLKLSGAVNPEQAAARAGNTEFARNLRQAAARDEMAQHIGHVKGEEFERLYKGAPESATAGAHTPGKGSQFIHEIEQGTGSHEAHDYFKNTLQDTGKRLQEHGIIDAPKDSTYVPRYARFRDDRGMATVGGLKKTGGFSKGRVQAGEFGEGGDRYKTFGEFKQAVESNKGSVADDPATIFRHTVATRERAIAHEQSLRELERTPMRDGNPAVITFNQSKGLPIKYQQLGYDTSLLPGRAVHPEAVAGVKSLTKNFTDNPAFGAFASVNSKAKRLVTINGVVHAKNFVLASVRKQGIYNTAKALFDLRRSGFAEEDVSRAIQHGWVPFEGAKMSLFDEANRGDGALGKALGPLGKLRQASDKVLFDGIGNRLSMSTYLKIEKAALKQNLSKEEAGVIAARGAKQVSFISSASESSQAYREISRVAFFAGQFLKSTLKEGATAAGLSRDQTLTKAAQTFEQRNAAKNLMRGFMYLFTGAQALNMATTGHPTWQNKDSKLSPVFHVDPTTGKEYHVTNFYGQIGELLNLNRPSTMINKLSPGIQAGSQIVANYQQFKGKQVYDKNASGPRQMLSIFKTALARILTPAGIDTTDAQKYFGPSGQPGKVTATQLLGYGTSTKDQNAMERDIIQRRNNALPAASPPANPQLNALKSAAKNDLRSGKKDSPALAQLKGSMSEKDYKAFLKTGGESDVQAAYDKLSTDEKFQIIEKYNPKQLSELDLTSAAKALVGSNAKSTYESLKAKGYTDQQIQTDLKKAGFDSGQLEQIKQEAKIQARQTSRQSRYGPKWQNPLLTR